MAGFKKFFKTKPPTQEDVETNVRESMNDKGMPVKSGSKKPSVFGAYANYANDRTVKKVYAPKGYEQYAENNRGDKIFAPKPEEEEDLNNTNGDNNNNNEQKANPYGNLNSSNSSNPYSGISNNTQSSNPYSGVSTSNASSSNPYSSNSSGQSGYGQPQSGYNQSSDRHNQSNDRYQSNNGYGQSNDGYNQYNQPSDGYSRQQQPQQQNYQNQQRQQRQPPQQQSPEQQYTNQRINPYGSSQQSSNQNPYASQQKYPSNPYMKQNNSQANAAAIDEDDLNYVPQEEDEEGINPNYQQQLQRANQQQQGFNFEEEDLNADVVRDDYNYGYQPEFEQEPELTEEELAQKQEDEEVEEIKNQIRFTKQESVASTRNTLKMAREAEESGQNTLGMLGAQSEMLYDVERNLSLAEAQSGIAKEKIGQIHHYNRSMFKPNVKNPFTKSRRLREQEAKIKSDRIQSKVEAEQQRRELASSTNRIKASLNEGEGLGDSVTNKYRRQKIQDEAKRYQFENDSEDDEMENELGENLDEIGKISGRLKKLAMTQSEEIDRQNYRIKDIEEKADRLDVNVHVNTASLSRAR